MIIPRCPGTIQEPGITLDFFWRAGFLFSLSDVETQKIRDEIREADHVSRDIFAHIQRIVYFNSTFEPHDP